MLALLKKTLRCSFCGKTEKEVARLLAGPHVHICDACVGACNKILEATRAVLQAMIEELRQRKVSWEAIGKALGISRQAAWERFS